MSDQRGQATEVTESTERAKGTRSSSSVPSVSSVASPSVASPSVSSRRTAAFRAVLWKEWREQRWRGVLGAVVMGLLAASLVRAQVVPAAESLLLLFGPLGLLLAIFLAMGNVATEKADGTWAFLTAQPAARSTLLRAKWLVGAAQLIAILLLAALAAYLAALSRGLFNLPPPPDYVVPAGGNIGFFAGSHSAAWLWRVALAAAISMLAWYSGLFFILTRARNELHAGLGGLLLSLAVIIWAAQYPLGEEHALTWQGVNAFHATSIFNPLAPLLSLAGSTNMHVLACGLALAAWVALPLWLVRRFDAPGRK